MFPCPRSPGSQDQLPSDFKLLVIPELKQRYLAHLRTVLEESFHPDVMTPLIDRLSTLSLPAIIADRRRNLP